MLDVHTDMDRRTRRGQKDVTLLDANEFKDTLKDQNETNDMADWSILPRFHCSNSK